MMQAPEPEREARFLGHEEELSASRIRAMLYRVIAPGFRPFAWLLWGLLALVLIGFVGLHAVVGWHWVYPESWLTAEELAYTEQKIEMLWSRVGGWVIPLAYFVWQVLSTRRE